MRTTWAAAIAIGVLALPSVATAAPAWEYTIKHPKHDRCQAHYLRWAEEVGRHAVVLCIYQPAPYTGPWTSAHEPSLISNADISLATGGAWALELTVSRHSWCVHGHVEPLTLTFSAPSGWESQRLEKRSAVETGCAPPPYGPESLGGKPGFELLDLPNTAGVNLESPSSEIFPEHNKPIPLFFEVSGRHGIIAQGPLTFEPAGPRTRHGGWPSA
jgi:hypothetical protein